MIGEDVLQSIRTRCNTSRRRLFALSEPSVLTFWRSKVESELQPDNLIVAPYGGEELKSLEGISLLWEQFASAKISRTDLIVIIGGGALIDAAGFAAATFMRGVDVVLVPTTLLSQIDSSIGGKNGINFSGVKNLLGTFASPEAVGIDPQFLSSLPEREFRSGIAEVLKHGMIGDVGILAGLTSHPVTRESFTPSFLAKVIEVKAAIVRDDPLERDRRRILNFGHTAGHALEALSLHTSAPLLHGEAVALGMVVALSLSRRTGMLPEGDQQALLAAIESAALPSQIRGISIDNVLQVMRLDKKVRDGQIEWVLLEAPGSARPGIRVEESLVRAALAEVCR